MVVIFYHFYIGYVGTERLNFYWWLQKPVTNQEVVWWCYTW